MEWFDGVKGTVKKTAEKAYEKSGKLIEIAKLNFKINELESGIDKLYVQIGTKAYAGYKDGNFTVDDVKNICELIGSKHEEIEILKKQINEIKDIRVCKNCQSKISADAKFCCECGEKTDK